MKKKGRNQIYVIAHIELGRLPFHSAYGIIVPINY